MKSSSCFIFLLPNLNASSAHWIQLGIFWGMVSVHFFFKYSNYPKFPAHFKWEGHYFIKFRCFLDQRSGRFVLASRAKLVQLDSINYPTSNIHHQNYIFLFLYEYIFCHCFIICFCKLLMFHNFYFTIDCSWKSRQ